MEIKKNTVCAFIPARGGSKTIKLKNLVEINNKPLIFYAISTLLKLDKVLDSIVCSTDHESIQSYVESFGIAVVPRPKSLSVDSSKTEESINHYLREYLNDSLPEFIFLVQPTSPLTREEDYLKLLSMIKEYDLLDSAQTICKVKHHDHAINQRIIKDGYVDFVYKNLRKKFYNKQKKPEYFKFGNLVIFRTKSFLNDGSIFGKKSHFLEIPEKYCIDIDNREDIKLLNFLIRKGFY